MDKKEGFDQCRFCGYYSCVFQRSGMRSEEVKGCCRQSCKSYRGVGWDSLKDALVKFGHIDD